MATAENQGPERAAAKSTNQPPPSHEQLEASRAERWHQDEKPLLSQEALREWIGRHGLVVYGRRGQQLGAPAPSLVEAILGRKLDADAAPETTGEDAARTLLTRLIAEGSAVPLNLLGASGGLGTDVPDFVASAAVFSYIFTLRGNKAWKQAPETSGTVKVSPLALAAYEMLVEKGQMTSYDLATQLGKEVTEGAVLRALTELWAQLRVLPLPQDGDAGTLWELTTARFTKQIKSGANAGLPAALSALLSLYLGQAVAATEDEIATFLSPLAARSKVREVAHALLSARQLETVVIDGKTLLHVTGELPGFATIAVPEAATEVEAGPEGSAPASRISKFAGKPGSKLGTGLRAKPAGARPAFKSTRPGGASARPPRPGFSARPAAGDRERRPFRREGDEGAARPRAERPPTDRARTDRARTDRPRFDKPWQERSRPAAGAEGISGSAEGGKDREAAPRKTFSKPGTFGRKREGFTGRPPREGSPARPPRRDSGAGEGRPPRREFGTGGQGAAGGFKRASFGASGSPPGSFKSGPRPGSGAKPFAGKKPFTPRTADRGEMRGGGDAEAPRRQYRKFDAPREGKFPPAKRAGGFERSERPAHSFDRPGGFKPKDARPASDGKRPAYPRKDGPPRSAAGRSGPPSTGRSGPPGGAGKKPFAKFMDGKKPFRSAGPTRKSAARKGPAQGGAAGGFSPTRRKRPEGGE